MNENLKFDSANKEDLAEAYSQKHNHEFRPIGGLHTDMQSTEYQLDKCNNKIYHRKDVHIPSGTHESGLHLSKVLKSVAQKVRENADLFAQIEAKTRSMEQDKVKRYDIELIAKEFEYYSELEAVDEVVRDLPFDVTFTADVPLCVLALLARSMNLSNYVHLVSKDVSCAVALHLFVQLCLEAGYPADHIAWTFIPESELLSSRKIESNGTTAVVTRTADIESAVACLLDASQDYRYPWRLRRVFVQENAFARFQRALARSADCAECEYPQFAARSASVHSRGDKCFLVEFCGAASDITARQRLVLVAAYRTTSELFKLLHSVRPTYLSLWCSDVSVSNEIAFGARCSVWLNDFVWLQGPHRHSHSWHMVEHLASLYWVGDIFDNFINKNENREVQEKLTSLRAEWLKMSIKKRREVILEVLRSKPNSSDFTLLIEGLLKWEPHTFAHVENGTLYQGFQEPRGVVACLFETFDCTSQLPQLLPSVVNGNGVLFTKITNETVRDLVEDLNSAGVPVMLTRMNNNDIFASTDVDCFVNALHPGDENVKALYRTRVISCHFGETFAN